MTSPALAFDRVHAGYGPFRALFDVSFEVPEGKHLVEFAFGETPLRMLAWGITLAGLGGIGAAVWLRRGMGVSRKLSEPEPGATHRSPPATLAAAGKTWEAPLI